MCLFSKFVRIRWPGPHHSCTLRTRHSLPHVLTSLAPGPYHVLRRMSLLLPHSPTWTSCAVGRHPVGRAGSLPGQAGPTSHLWAADKPQQQGSCGLVDEALVFGARDCRFVSCQDHVS